jgi:predicted DNA-binding protein
MAKKPEIDGSQMIRLNFYIEPEQKARLERLSEQTDRPVAAMLRRAIESYLDEEEAMLRRRKG